MRPCSTLVFALLASALLAVSVPGPAAAQEIGVEVPPPAYPPVFIGEPCDRYRTHGYVGGQLGGIAAVAQTAGEGERYLSRFGGEIGLTGGLRVNPYLSLEGNWTFALHDEARRELDRFQSIYITTFTADIKAHLPTDSPMEPYLQAGGGVVVSGGIALDNRQADSSDAVSVGATITAGCGLDVWVTRHIAMGARVLYRAMALGETDEAAGRRFRNVVHGITVDALASIHF
jgi:hypothetical protein